MAERRMFAKTIIDSDAFLDMPLSTQALYFHLGMRADDDGFLNNPKKIQRIVGSSDDDFKLLIAKRFIIPFESGVVVLKHWKIHNYIQNDRYKETVYSKERSMLDVKKNKAYTLKDGQCIHDVYSLEAQVRLGKDSIGKVSIGKDSIDIYNNINTIDKDIRIEDNSILAQSDSEKPNTSEPLADVSAIILNNKEEWLPTQKQLDEYIKLYPAVDVVQEFNAMRAWSLSNPTKRKTARGVSRFVNSWLSKEQDRGGKSKQQNNSAYMDSIKNRVSEVDKWV